MKKIALIFGSVVLVLVIAIASIPFFINVDKFREPLQKEINQKINGRVEIGKLSLSLLGKIRFQIDGLKLEGERRSKILSVKDASIEIPYTSLLAAAPSATLVLNAPEVWVRKERDGKLNLVKLIKTEEAGATSQAESGTSKGVSESSKPTEIPGFLARATASLSIENAALFYEDLTVREEPTRVDGLSLVLKDLSLDRPIGLQLKANLKLEKSRPEKILLLGPVSLLGKLELLKSDSSIDGAKFDFVSDLSESKIIYGTLFNKAEGMKLKVNVQGSATQAKTDISSLKLEFGDLELSGNLQTTPVMTSGELQSNLFSVEKLASSIALLSSYQLSGECELETQFKMPVNQPPVISGKAVLKGLQGNLPELNKRFVVNGTANFAGNTVQLNQWEFGLGSTKFRFNAVYKNLANPTLSLGLASSLLDLDELFPVTASTSGGGNPQGAPAKANGGAGNSRTESDPLAALRENPFLRNFVMMSKIKIDQVKTHGLLLKNLESSFSLNRLNLSIQSLRAEYLEGNFTTGGGVNLALMDPPYRFNLSLRNIHIQNVLKAYFPKFGNSLTGNLTGDVAINGRSLDPEPAKKNLTGSGKLHIKDGQLYLVDVAGILEKSLKKIPKVGDKLSGKAADLKGKDFQAFKTMDADFKIKDEVLNFSRIDSDGGTKSPDIRGSGTVGFDNRLDLNFNVIDRNGQLKRLDPNLIGEMAPKSGATFELPLRLKGDATNPKPDYGYTTKILAERYAKNTVKSQVKKLVNDKKVDQIKDKAKDAAKKLFKGLF